MNTKRINGKMVPIPYGRANIEWLKKQSINNLCQIVAIKSRSIPNCKELLIMMLDGVKIS